ncbi:MAG: TetR/AcrR family transcriptional regulator [Bacteroidota bacterium]
MARTKGFNEAEALEKAVALFWEKGYQATSANDLVEHLGLSRSSLYATFGDKRSLYLSAIQWYRKSVVTQTLAMIENSEDLRLTIAEIFNAITKQDIGLSMPKGCFMVNSAIELAAHDPEMAQLIAANQQDIESAFVLAIEKGQAAGQLNTTFTAPALARFLYNHISGLRVLLRTQKDARKIDEMTQICLSVLRAST